jgi:hypothetical protein
VNLYGIIAYKKNKPLKLTIAILDRIKTRRVFNLGLLDRFRRKEKEQEIQVESEKSLTELEGFCGRDQETYEALSNAMFLDPRKIDVSMSAAAKEAKKLEKAKDFVRARVWYEIAGGLAIYEGDVKKVIEYFGKSEKISPEIKYPILKNPKSAVAKAQEYYKKYLKD